MQAPTPNARRRFLMRVAAAAAVAPLLSIAYPRPARAADLPKLALDNAQAKALAYTEDASSVSHASFKAGSSCANCQFIQGDEGAEYRPCQLFPGHSVASKGWCSAWAKKA